MEFNRLYCCIQRNMEGTFKKKKSISVIRESGGDMFVENTFSKTLLIKNYLLSGPSWLALSTYSYWNNYD